MQCIQNFYLNNKKCRNTAELLHGVYKHLKLGFFAGT